MSMLCILLGGHFLNAASADSREVNSKSQAQSKSQASSIAHTFTLQIADGGGFPFPNSEFNYTVELNSLSSNVISISLPQLNFETNDTYAPANWLPFQPLGGYVTTASRPLPERYRPKTDLTFVVSTNDGFLQPIDFNAYSPGPPVTGVVNPLPAYNVIIDTYGNLTISACGTYFNIIPSGGHTLNGTVVSYKLPPCQSCYKNLPGFNEFIIQKAFTNFSLFSSRAANDGIRDSHFNDAVGKLAAWTWTDNSSQQDKTADNILLDCYVALGDIKNGVKVRAPINITNYQEGSQLMAWDTAVAINQNQTAFPGNVVVSLVRLAFNTQLDRTGTIPSANSSTITNIDTTDFQVGYLVSDTSGYVPVGTTIATIGTNQITLSAPTTWPGPGSVNDTIIIIPGIPLEFTGDIATAGSNIISNIPVAAFSQVSDALGAVITDTGGFIPAGTTIVNSLPNRSLLLSQNMTNTAPVTGDEFVVEFSWGTPGSFRPADAMVAVSQDSGRTFGAPFVIDPSLNFPNAAVGDGPGVQCDKFGNMWFLINVDESGTYNALNLRFYVSGDGGNTWTLYFQTTDAIFDPINPANSTGSYDYPQFCFGNDGLGNYGIWFEGDYFTASSGYENNEARLGFLPITGLYPAITPIPPADSTNYYTIVPQNQPNLLNTINLVTLAAKNDGTLFMECCIQNGVGAIALFTKPPGDFNTPVVGPWTIDQIINQWLAGVASYPFGVGRPYFPVTVKNIIVDEARGALYAIVCEQLYFTSQDYNLFMMVSLDNGVTWSEKIPLASTTSQNRGFSSATLNPADQALYVGYYDARNIDPNPPVGTVPHSSLQYYGLQLTKEYLDTLIKRLKH